MSSVGMHHELYDILGVEVDCDQTEIKKAYRRCAKQCHPDRNPGVDPDLFKKVSHAYEILSDPQKREKYDKYGEQGLHGTNNNMFTQDEQQPYDDLFSAFFGSSFDDFGEKTQNLKVGFLSLFISFIYVNREGIFDTYCLSV